VLRKKGASGSAPFEFFLTRIEGTTAESRAGRKWVGGSRCLANAAGGSEESRWFWVITLLQHALLNLYQLMKADA